MSNTTLPLVDREQSAPARPLPATSLPWRVLLWLVGWAWRLYIATTCCTSYYLSIFFVGWLARWTQARIVVGWWKQSPRRGQETFAAFCERLGPDGPTPRPRWLLRQPFRWDWIRAEINAPTGENEPATLRRLWRWVTVPLGSLTRNLSLGIAGTFGTFLLLGWGTALLMTFAWTYGWLNSFHKGYEEAFVGPSLGISGLLLMASSLVYLPMAQLHFAATGELRAFLQLGLVWKLIRARLGSYALLTALLVFFTGAATVVGKIVPLGLGNMDWAADLTDAETLAFLRQYYWWCSLGLVLALLVTHGVGAAIYRAALLKVLQRGWVRPEELPPRLVGWLEALEILPEPCSTPRLSAGLLARKVLRLGYRGALVLGMFLLWVLPIPYLGEFTNYHPADGVLNQPMVLLPAFDSIPAHLKETAAAEKRP